MGRPPGKSYVAAGAFLDLDLDLRDSILVDAATGAGHVHMQENNQGQPGGWVTQNVNSHRERQHHRRRLRRRAQVA